MRQVPYSLFGRFCVVLTAMFLASAALSQNVPVQNVPAQNQAKTSTSFPVAPVTKISMTPAATDPLNPNGASNQPPGKRLWNLQDADILSVINEVSQETGKNFVVDPRVSGKISLISSKPLKQSEVYQVFLSVLSVLGYSAIPTGNVVKIMPNMESLEQATPVATNHLPGHGDEIVVRVIPLENISASQLIPVLRPMLPQWSNISAYTPGNVIILMGRASNLDRIRTVIEDVDHASTSGIQMIPLRHASAQQLAIVLNNLQAASRASGESNTVSIAVDERSNSLLLGGPKASRLRMRVLIAQLDAPTKASEGNTEVVYLRYLEAKTFAPLLGKIASNILGKSAGAQYESSSASLTTNTSTTTSTTKEVVTNSTNIQAEVSTNALIITAPPALMRALKEVIRKLDIRPAQVLVEAIIAEIDESNLLNFGIQWGSVAPANSNTASNTAPVPTAFPPFGAGVFGLIPSVQLEAVLSMLRNQTGVDILSTPSIMVLDNQKALIEIGQDVPTQNGSYATTGTTGTVTPFNTTQYKPVTLSLEVTPQINLNASMRLKIKLKNDTLQNPQNPTSTPLINTSKIENSVMIHTDDVLVIGGLIKNTNNEIINKVPILGDIPILGPLFQQKVSGQEKRNLVVFIKPIIVKDDCDAAILSESKYNMIRRTEANFKQDLATIGDKPAPTALPPWKNKQDLPTPFKPRCPKGSLSCQYDPKYDD